MSKTLLAIDGNSLLFRAFYALPLMENQKGEYTNAIYGFFSMIFNALAEVKPDDIVVAFDVKGPVFRHQTFSEYKAGRKETPSELVPQFALLKKALDMIGIKYVEKPGFEADDLLGAFAKVYEKNGDTTYLLTGDRDTYQLISDKINVFLTKKGVSELLVVDEEKLEEIYTLKPDQMVDLKGLMGDASDNIPGVKGVGEKTAVKLLSAYQTIEGVYDHIDEIKGALKEKLIKDKDNALMSREIGTIVTQIDGIDTQADYHAPEISAETLTPAFTMLEFRTLLKRFGGEVKETAREIETEAVDSTDKLKDVISEIEKSSVLGIVFEENMVLAASENKDYELVCEHSLLSSDFTITTALELLSPVLNDESIKKVIYDAKGVKHKLADFGIAVGGLVFDTKLAEYVLDPTAKSFALDAVQRKYDINGKAALLLAVWPKQQKRIQADALTSIMDGVEMPLLNVLFDMEQCGFKVDKKALLELQTEYDKNIETTIARIYHLAGFDDFNINSTKQLGEVLFERLGLPIQKKTKTGYSTDIEVLQKLEDKHPVIAEIISYRKLTKLKSTYIDGLLGLIDSEGKVHSTFNQISTATGRISSTEPNLQNIPIRTQEGREIRRVFVPSQKDGILVAADYSQIELRVLADIAEDANMIDAFRKNQDIHTRTASQVFDVPIDEVTSRLRSDAKAVNFGIVYGISGFGLARNLGISVNRAQAYIDKYLAEFSGIANYMERVKNQAKEDGFVRTSLGRIRYIRELSSNNYNIRSFGERAALNTPIQGTAADIIKLAMIKVDEALKERKMVSQLILQVHDELIVDAAANEAEEVSSLLKDLMEHVVELKVPLVANVSRGKTWYEAK
ncbi:MAG: DNA polymerase I [Eubacteriales bacterium]